MSHFAPYSLSSVQLPVFYSPEYNISFWSLERLHPFDPRKYEKVYAALCEAGLLSDACVVLVSTPISDDELRLVHPQAYLDSLRKSSVVARLTEVIIVAIIPNVFVQRRVLRPMRLCTAGSIGAALSAMRFGWGINLGGGYHHCSAAEGGGFCVFADITLMVQNVRHHFPYVRRVLIVDLDAHQGNGHERDFHRDVDVVTLDIYNHQIYPNDEFARNKVSLIDVPVPCGTDDKAYIPVLRDALQRAMATKPDFIVYNAGTDCLVGDPLGQMALTSGGIKRRDEMVFAAAFAAHVPIAMVLSGGYQKNNGRVIADSLINLHDRFGLFDANAVHSGHWSRTGPAASPAAAASSSPL